MVESAKSPPAILYKYREFSYRNLAFLLNHAIYIPSADQLNDPFDCGVKLGRAQIPPEEFMRLFGASIGGVADTAKASAEAKGVGRAIVGGTYSSAFRAHIEKFAVHVEGEAARIGVVSLSETPESTTMWSHYAGGHTGFCVGYATSKIFPKMGEDSLHKVSYVARNELAVNAYQVFASTCGAKNAPVYEATLNAAFSTKLNDWEYEREWRFLSPNVSKCTRELRHEAIQSIHFGLRSKAMDRIALRNLLADHPMTFYRMRMTEDGTGLDSIPLGKATSEWTEPESFE